MKIVILDGYTINPGDLSWSEFDKVGEVTVYDRTSQDQLIQRIGKAEAVLTSKCVLTKEVMEQCPNLSYIGILATGINMVDLAYANEREIKVTNIPAYSTESVAQLTISLLLEICNRVQKHSDAVTKGLWSESKDFCFTVSPQMELMGKTIGIIGFGNIGRRVARIAEAFGMRVLISTRYPDRNFATEQIHFANEEEILSSSDIISLHCPLTESNKGFINQSTLSKMKDGVILLNTSRGPLINEADLKRALETGKVYAAGLDVLSAEPPREGNPLIGMDSCIITPHIAWITKESRIRLIGIAAANLTAFAGGKELNSVNHLKS
ncbi:D-2-hydroxyacid dehydrogenase [Sinanaerobacter chloroacetimidivorans]|jgi:glycerate dehydrogenase|uniref:D-2-hydroxyacid dehydrogenase n=1 Tax=Sinanaerobacter chloroacetimidivorans TaxID=2818044 RepID=A0A8J7W476_9FIRM|nr:D-2-hydroxyacid dehydrogenase [Sinanaerobacter chloroacetimidivorans]MBR0600214.1 D-2-hydroxyacid dehydrogenase [Sinanaerobacter chloroacetimidivorans]